jgi:glycosyltransferase involved in cell wall biosynthesis
MITVLTVNHNTLDFLKLLVQSVRKFRGRVPTEIMVIDNQSTDGSREWAAAQPDIEAKLLTSNTGHGPGLDYGLRLVRTKFVLVLDSDAHLQRVNWDTDLIQLYQSDSRRRLIAARGGVEKAIHPCFMFFETEYFRRNQFSFVARDGYDVGRRIYYDVIEDVLRIECGYENGGQNFYPGTYGTEYYIYGRPTIFHAWYATRMTTCRVGDSVDDYKKEDFLKDKSLVFSMPLVREILAHEENPSHSSARSDAN